MSYDSREVEKKNQLMRGADDGMIVRECYEKVLQMMIGVICYD